MWPSGTENGKKLRPMRHWREEGTLTLIVHSYFKVGTEFSNFYSWKFMENFRNVTGLLLFCYILTKSYSFHFQIVELKFLQFSQCLTGFYS